MKKSWLQFWNERYAKQEYAYGTIPNLYFKEQLDKIAAPGKILLGAEGEGRNALYAAQKGWKVSAFDISHEGRKKAMELAQKNQLTIDEYQVGELPELTYQSDQFDLIALIYAHFPPAIKSDYHQRLSRYLRTGGLVIFEAFSKSHLEYRNKYPKIGGPSDLDMLFSMDEIRNDFKNFDIVELEETVVELAEGNNHIGIGSVIRFVGNKL